MTHDEAFAELQARKRAEEAATVKVTWRKVSPMTGGGWSGLGPNGQLVFVNNPDASRRHRGYDFGTRDGNVKTIKGSAPTLALAKIGAAKLFDTDVEFTIAGAAFWMMRDNASPREDVAAAYRNPVGSRKHGRGHSYTIRCSRATAEEAALHYESIAGLYGDMTSAERDGGREGGTAAKAAARIRAALA